MCCWTVGISSLRHVRACKCRRRGGVLWKSRVFDKNGCSSVTRHAPCSQRRHRDLWPESNAAHPLELDWDRRTHRVLYKCHRSDPPCVVHQSLNSSTQGRIKKDHWVLREARGCSNSDVPVFPMKPISGHSAVRTSCPLRTRIHFVQLDKSIFFKKMKKKANNALWRKDSTIPAGGPGRDPPVVPPWAVSRTGKVQGWVCPGSPEPHSKHSPNH